MRLIQIIDALAPNAARGRHESSWRPLPPSRTKAAAAIPFVSPQVASLLGIATAVTLIGSMVAVALPAETGPGFSVTPLVEIAPDPQPIVFEPAVEFVLPDATVSTFETASTMADPSFEIERRSTTTMTLPPPTPEELITAQEEADTLDRRRRSMTAVGFEDDLVSNVEELPSHRPAPATGAECRDQAQEIDLTPDGRWDRTAIAKMTSSLFECVLSLNGLDEVAPSRVRGWDGAAIWGFESLADQMAAEAVVVSYCESIGYQHRALTGSNGFGYAGLFQMGRTEMNRFGAGGSRYDPVDNAFAAVNYVWYQYANRNGWGGWSPWAVVNTNFNDEVNDRVKVPVLPRFASTDPEFLGRRGPELPAWAVDPWTNVVPAWNGCPHNGGRW